MCKNNHPFLVQNSLPYFIEFVNPEQLDDSLEVASDIDLIHF